MRLRHVTCESCLNMGWHGVQSGALQLNNTMVESLMWGIFINTWQSVGVQDRILKFSEAQHPIVLQLGGSSPEKLLKAAKLASVYGYDEINLKYAFLSKYLPCFQDNCWF